MKVYGERLLRFDGTEYREWSPFRSKLAAYLSNGGRNFRPGDAEHWLYLGAASGTTVSHVSDLLPQGRVLGVEMAHRPFVDLLRLAVSRRNLVPVLSDAGHPETYAPLVERSVDVVYQDIAQRDQDRLFRINLARFLKKDGWGFLAVKARSVDVAAPPAAIYQRVAASLEREGWRIVERVRLDPWAKDHAMLVVRRA